MDLEVVMKALIVLALLGCTVQPARTQEVKPPAQNQQDRQAEIDEIRATVKALSARLSALEAPAKVGPPPVTVAVIPPAAAEEPLKQEDHATLAFFRGTTLNFGMDGYYGYNFNHPIGRVNLLRAYDVSSNSFNINQASVVVERLPVAAPGQRFGGMNNGLRFGAIFIRRMAAILRRLDQAWRLTSVSGQAPWAWKVITRRINSIIRGPTFSTFSPSITWVFAPTTT
jgi:hypothetical protein